MSKTFEERRIEVIKNYVALRTDQAKGVGDPTDSLNRLCEFFVKDAVIVGRDQQTYDGIDAIAKYLACGQPAIPSCSAPVKDAKDDTYTFTLTFMLVKAVKVTVRFDTKEPMKFDRIYIEDGGILDGVAATVQNMFNFS